MSENYIPCSRSRLIELCMGNSSLEKEDRIHFQQLCKILLAYIHLKEQETLEKLKDGYSCYDPDIDEICLDDEGKADQFLDSLTDSLLAANYTKIEESEIQAALNQASLIPVQTSVDFSVYQRYSFFYQETNRQKITEKKWFKNVTRSFDNYTRMVVLLHINEDLQQTGDEEDTLRAGRIYLYLYKNIPHHDLEMLFPSLKISMTLKDKLILIIPAVGAAIPMLLKVIPSLALLTGAVLFFTFGMNIGTGFDIEKQDNKAIYALLTAVLSIGIALGGFAGRQYIKYKSKRLSFLKHVTDILFFKCLDTGSGVIHKIIDSAEEELCKEMILVLHVLSATEKPLSKKEIDTEIEELIKIHLYKEMDFNVHKALDTLVGLTASDRIDSKDIIHKDTNNRYSIVQLSECKIIIDRLMDNVFQYN